MGDIKHICEENMGGNSCQYKVRAKHISYTHYDKNYEEKNP